MIFHQTILLLSHPWNVLLQKIPIYGPVTSLKSLYQLPCWMEQSLHHVANISCNTSVCFQLNSNSTRVWHMFHDRNWCYKVVVQHLLQNCKGSWDGLQDETLLSCL